MTTELKIPVGTPPQGTAIGSGRLTSLDAYRGLIMLLMGSAGFGFARVAEQIHTGLWPWLGYHTSHAAWEGCAFWDLIQPAFMFMVGTAIPYSYARREGEGQSCGQMLRHAAVRSVVLILLAIFLISPHARQTNFAFTTVLAQIGLGYVPVVLLRNRGIAIQAAAVAAILLGTWCLFFFYPVPQPGPALDPAAYGLKNDWPHFSGAAAHWNKNTNVAASFDRWFLNLFPRERPFTFEPGGYQTLNFVPSMATMILGLMAGELLRSKRTPEAKLAALALAGAVLLAAGLVAGWTICPIIKRIWTPSWVLFSGAWVVWMLAALYGAIDVAGYRRWTFPLVVVGMNSIVMYVMVCLLLDWTWSMLKIHLGSIVASIGPNAFDPVYLPIVQSLSVLFVFWLACYWLYRQKFFVRI